jgi:hypothetical protein
MASIATLHDIESQRNPKRVIDVRLTKPSLRIGSDAFELKVKSNHDGYVYLVLLGSDSKSFYILFPNGLDGDNKIRANEWMTLPRADWQIKANGPVGADQVLVMVADSPRQLDSLDMSAATEQDPFTYALNNLGGRAALIEFLTGAGVRGQSDSFGAKLLTVKEVK